MITHSLALQSVHFNAPAELCQSVMLLGKFARPAQSPSHQTRKCYTVFARFPYPRRGMILFTFLAIFIALLGRAKSQNTVCTPRVFPRVPGRINDLPNSLLVCYCAQAAQHLRHASFILRDRFRQSFVRRVHAEKTCNSLS